jgi:hypothetical protein
MTRESVEFIELLSVLVVGRSDGGARKKDRGELKFPDCEGNVAGGRIVFWICGDGLLYVMGGTLTVGCPIFPLFPLLTGGSVKGAENEEGVLAPGGSVKGVENEEGVLAPGGSVKGVENEVGVLAPGGSVKGVENEVGVLAPGGNGEGLYIAPGGRLPGVCGVGIIPGGCGE